MKAGRGGVQRARLTICPVGTPLRRPDATVHSGYGATSRPAYCRSAADKKGPMAMCDENAIVDHA